jgi:hypothetical protein
VPYSCPNILVKIKIIPSIAIPPNAVKLCFQGLIQENISKVITIDERFFAVYYMHPAMSI